MICKRKDMKKLNYSILVILILAYLITPIYFIEYSPLDFNGLTAILWASTGILMAYQAKRVINKYEQK
jgi:predicted membrane channel-forming protein YqfA (hemolysin III family)